MRPFLLQLLFTLTTVGTIISQNNTVGQDKINQLVEEVNIVGVVAAYAVDGEVRWKGGAGWSCEKTETKFTDTTLTRIASIAKPMTAVAIMQLVEKGVLGLDEPIKKYLDDFPTKEKGDITTRHLLGHTSGISQYQNTEEVENTQNFKDLQAAMAIFKDRPLLFESGSDFFYTSYGYVVLGRIIEEVSGLSFEEYMQENIWQPAGMTRTMVEKAGIDYQNKACLYHKKRKKAKPAQQNDLSNRVPGGGFISTLDDMLSFGNALLNGKLVSVETLEVMSSSQFAQKEGNPYGLGFFLYGPPPHEHLVIGHSGEQTGCAAQLMLIPKSKTVVVVLANTSGTWKEVVNVSGELIRLSETE
jgi:serine beta-lactamase-like protein LACTB